MLEAWWNHLLVKSNLHLYVMELFLLDECAYPYLSPRSATPCVVKGGQRRRLDKKAKEQNADSRNDYCYLISEFCSYYLFYVDESWCDKRIGFRQTGRSPLGIAPVQVSKFNRDQQYQILPPYVSTSLLQESVNVSIYSTISTL